MVGEDEGSVEPPECEYPMSKEVIETIYETRKHRQRTVESEEAGLEKNLQRSNGLSRCQRLDYKSAPEES